MDNNNKEFKVIPNLRDGLPISWDVIRVRHKTKGNYLMAKFYERGSIQLFIEALKTKGFVQNEENE